MDEKFNEAINAVKAAAAIKGTSEDRVIVEIVTLYAKTHLEQLEEGPQ